MPEHVFVDESKVRGLLIAAAVCDAADVTAQRKAMRALLLPGQRRLHFTKESPARRRKILGVLTEFDLHTRLYRSGRDDSSGRRSCLTAVVRDAAASAERLLVERDESTVEFDRRTLFDAVRAHGCAASLTYAVVAAHTDPLLWIPDAVAWCWTAGRDWRELVEPICAARGL